MQNGSSNIYQTARKAAGLTQEAAAERLALSVESLRAYETGDRLALGVTAPPHGLELTKVHYPEAAFIRPEDIRWHEE